MNYVNLSYESIINDIKEYIEDNKIKLKKRTFKKKNNKSKKNKKI